MSGEQAARLLAERIASLELPHGRPPLVGLNGAQGAGKSTIAHQVADLLARDHARPCLVLALDDFYLTRSERLELAAQVHPLCATRGVPGTHDVALMEQTLRRLATAVPDEATRVPRFDKLADDRLPESESAEHHGRPSCVLLEGWCVGICRTDLPEWQGPINPLEAEHDPDGAWHAWSRTALAAYEKVWDVIDILVSIEVPGWQTVIGSRLQQERGLKRENGRTGMDRAAVIRFAEHYQRYTCALWAAMPARADLLLHRDARFRFELRARPQDASDVISPSLRTQADRSE